MTGSTRLLLAVLTSTGLLAGTVAAEKCAVQLKVGKVEELVIPDAVRHLFREQLLPNSRLSDCLSLCATDYTCLAILDGLHNCTMITVQMYNVTGQEVESQYAPSAGLDIWKNVEFTTILLSIAETDNSWSSWQTWSACSKSCDYGTKVRNRTCTIGNNCTGAASENAGCNSFPCSDICYTLSDLGKFSYSGNVSVTASGRTCQVWNATSPHEPTPGLIEDMHNLCRNPDSSPYGVWCYTMDAATRWEYCDVPACEFQTGFITPNSACYRAEDSGFMSYNGTMSTTSSGKTCQAWNIESPHVPGGGYPDYPHNYCRNPDREPKPWCYTTSSSTRYELCDVPQC